MSLRSYLARLADAEEQYADLQALTGREDNSDILEMAVEICKMGLRPDDVQHAIRAHHYITALNVTADEIRDFAFAKYREHMEETG